LTVADLLASVERGDYPPADGGLTLLPSPCDRDAAVVTFTGHVVVVADVSSDWLARHLRPGELSEAFTPPFLGAIAAELGRRINAIDLLALATPLHGDPPIELRPTAGSDHPRVRRACRYRSEVSVWHTDGGLVAVGRGFADRWEVAVEVDPDHQGRGLGRRLATAARHLVPDQRSLWAQIAPGNAASVRAFLAAGFRPVGQEALLVQH
jgi:GNAT superfamily N-acetyltransferase